MIRRPCMSCVLFLALIVTLSQAQDFETGVSQEIRVTAGQNVVMTCNATNTDQSTVYEWRKPNDPRPVIGQTLVVQRVSKRDEGVYSCRAITNINGKIYEDVRSTSIVLKPKRKTTQVEPQQQAHHNRLRQTNLQNDDNLMSDQQLIIVPPGNSFTATIPMGITRDCRIERGESDDYDIKWFTPGGIETNYGSILYIYVDTRELEGVYKCEATHKVTGDKLTALFNLLINPIQSEDVINIGGGDEDDNGAPILEFNPPAPNDVVQREYGAQVYQTCSVRSDPDSYRLHWVGPDQRRISDSSFFFFSNVDPSQAGEYICVATHVRSQREYRKSLRLIVTGGSEGNSGEPASVRIEKTQGDLREGGYIVLSANVENGVNEDYSFEWIGPDRESKQTGQSFYLVLNEETLQGSYSCEATNIQTAAKISDSFNVAFSRGGRVVVPPVDTSDYRVIITANPTAPIFGGRYDLTCETEPRLPNARFQWFVGGNLRSDSSQLLIPNVQRNDVIDVDYECRVNYNGVARTANQKIEYTVHNTRELRLAPPPGPQIVVRMGDRKELHCEVERSSSGNLRGRDVQWFFQGAPLRVDASRGVERMDRVMVSIITLNSIDQYHEGKYECRLNGILKEAYIIVLTGESASLEVNPAEYSTNVNEVVEFHCRANNIPGIVNTDLLWFFVGSDKNGQERPLRSEWQKIDSPSTIETSFITVERAQLSDAGYYRCRVNPNKNSNVGPAYGLLKIVGGREVEIRVSVYPQTLRITPNTRASINCDVTENGVPAGIPMWRFRDGRTIIQDPRFLAYPLGIGRSELAITGLLARDSPVEVECYYLDKSDRATITIGYECGPSSFRCNSGNECFDRSKRCDGVRDCQDGSDEDPSFCAICDPLDVRCEIYNGVQPVKRTYSPSWQCDGEDDCGNGYDEANCRKTGNVCGGTEFQCRDGLTIPRAYLCDKENDCRNGDDEIGCSGGPIILNSLISQRVQRVPIGSTVVLTCQATGKPLPKVIWRFNWRCLPDASRMTISTMELSCDKVESQLKIENVRPQDDGIYNCEALSANQRAISDDYQVNIFTNNN